uniref:C2H2-type domain-containing protein n=1 Tax=Hucho hucho TaxID=62062 RepID=A0A4W5P103_9TELE
MVSVKTYHYAACHLSERSYAPEPLDAATPSSLEERVSLPQVRGIEDGRDLLTCGQCSQAFPLAHILAFIQHKQGGCRSRNHAPNTHTPPSPANRTQRRGAVTQVEAGFVELRRVTDRSGGEEHKEPSCFTCQLCECVLPSAWALLQHAQHTHSFSIYQEDGEQEKDDEEEMGSGGHQHSKPAATLDPCQLSHTLATAFHPSHKTQTCNGKVEGKQDLRTES